MLTASAVHLTHAHAIPRIKLFNEDLADASEYLHGTFSPIVLTPEDLILPGPGLVLMVHAHQAL